MKHLVIIGLVLPEPQSTAAGFRMMQLLHCFKRWDYKITFLTSANNVEFSEKIEYQKININDERFNAQVKDLKPDIILFDRYISEEQYGWRVTEACPNALKILDTEDLHFLREARKQAYKENRKLNDKDLLNDIFKREMASILRCDLSLIISEYEIQLLTEKYKINPKILFYLPFLYFKKNITVPDFQTRKNFISIGNFLHEPNWQTVLILKRIWKNIRKKIPNAQLHIYGAYANNKVFQLHQEKEGFLVLGRASSLESVFQEAKVLLAPIPFGAGLKGKLFESMKLGLPNVTTTIGAEGMLDNGQWNGLIADGDEDIIQAAVQLYSNENLWKKSIDYGFKILENKFDTKKFIPFLKAKIDSLLSDLSSHRNQNYMGQILQHHSLQSTKYLSKWIEEKEKKHVSKKD